MSAPTVDRAEVLAFADEHGTAGASERFGVPPGTIRSWRSRGTVTDSRAPRDSAPAETADAARPVDEPTLGLVDTSIADGGYDQAFARPSRVPARAAPIERFTMGPELMSEAPLQDLGVEPGTAGRLRPGDLLLLGGERFAQASEAVWEMVEHAGGWRAKYEHRPITPGDPDPLAGWVRLRVRPAILQPTARQPTQLSADRSRIEPVPPEDPEARRDRERKWKADTEQQTAELLRLQREHAAQFPPMV